MMSVHFIFLASSVSTDDVASTVQSKNKREREREGKKEAGRERKKGEKKRGKQNASNATLVHT